MAKAKGRVLTQAEREEMRELAAEGRRVAGFLSDGTTVTTDTKERPYERQMRQIAREVAEEVFASKVASALADPDVKEKSALGYLLGKVRRR